MKPGARHGRASVPIRCIEDGQDILAFDLAEAEWLRLRDRNRSCRHLRMPCCNSAVVLKVSPRGTRFFAHQARDGCVWSSETEAHRQVKRLVIEAARLMGWDGLPEVSGESPDCEGWRADVLLSKGERRVAVEVQWSMIAEAEMLMRQQRYETAGIRCLWLLQRSRRWHWMKVYGEDEHGPFGRELPCVRLCGSVRDGFFVSVPVFPYVASGWCGMSRTPLETVLPVGEFIQLALLGRFRHQPPLNLKGWRAEVCVFRERCWRCHGRGDFVGWFNLVFRGHVCFDGEREEPPTWGERVLDNIRKTCSLRVGLYDDSIGSTTTFLTRCVHCGNRCSPKTFPWGRYVGVEVSLDAEIARDVLRRWVIYPVPAATEGSKGNQNTRSV